MKQIALPWHHCALTPKHITGRMEVSPDYRTAYCLGCGKVVDTIMDVQEITHTFISLELMRYITENAHTLGNQEGGESLSG